MGMVIAMLGGFLAVILGLIGLIVWRADFFTVLAGTIPIILIMGGGIALFISITEIKDTLKSKEEESRFDTLSEESKSESAHKGDEEKEQD